MRLHLLNDFTQIYHLDLHGNVRKNPKLSGTTHNVFGIQVGVGITIAIRNSRNPARILRYHRVPEFWRKTEKLTFLAEKKSIKGIDWLDLQPDEKYTWITEAIQPEFDTFLPLGTKEAKTSHSVEGSIFKTYSGGVKTNRDKWTYDFNFSALADKIKRFIVTYNSIVDSWKRRGREDVNVDDFVTYDDRLIKWSENLKIEMIRGRYVSYSEQSIRRSLYRPFTVQYLYFDPILIDRRLHQYLFFPTPSSELENSVICLSGVGSNKPFHCLCTNIIPGFDLLEKTQCFPFYTYKQDGTNRRENITDWVLSQFQTKYGSAVTKWDIFYYVYALLHHPQYPERYAENLKRDLPHIPLLHSAEAFLACVSIGKRLMDLHLNYEKATEYPLKWIEKKDIPFSWRMEKMRLIPDCF